MATTEGLTTKHHSWLLQESSAEALYQWEAHWRWLEACVAVEAGGAYAEQARERVEAGAEVSALEALAASARLADELTRRRWVVMRSAREAGASWSEIGTALGMSKQGAHDWYKKAVAKRSETDSAQEIARATAAL